MAHTHDHEHATGPPGTARRDLAVAAGANSVLLVVQVVGAIAFGSLALLADSVHQASDVVSLFLAVGIAIDDMMLENGPLMVIPGSHKGRIYDHHQDGIFVGAVTEEVEGADRAVPITLKAGGISIHHARALHASMPNVSDRPRRLLLFQYCAIDAWPLLGVPTWEAFVGKDVLRGVAVQEPRLAAVPVRIPLPNGERGGSIYETQSMLKRSTLVKSA